MATLPTSCFFRSSAKTKSDGFYGMTWSSIEQLPDEDLINVVRNVDVATILKFRTISRRIYMLSRVKQIWARVFQHEILGGNLPVALYWKNIDVLHASQLEGLVLHALRLNHNIKQQHSPLSIPLVATSSDDVSSSICVWSIASLLYSRTCVAPLDEAFLPAPVRNGAVDVDGPLVTLALELVGR
ncbi:hypothetical protein QCA50_012323 [Cerrena zonata]|uniref:F-box domain-containing protein n=1 Tax=Cerrena zonata TaxID=2478898 RepID=A0AAW0G3Y2_9APHY